MFKRRLLFFLIVCFGLLVSAGSVFACGGLFCQNVPVAQQAERIIFTMNSDDTITAYVQINFTGDAPDFSWIVPVPTVPDVDVAEMDTFDELDRLTQPIVIPPPIPDCAIIAMPMMAGAVMEDENDDVIILASGTAGPYGFDVVDSPDPNALIVWLRENEYQVTQEMEPLIHVYNEEGMPFLAMKLQPEAGAQDIQPVALTYESEFPMIPIRLTAVAATPNMNILTWIFADEQAYPENYETPVIDATDLRGDFMNFTGNNYMQLVDLLADEADGLAMVTEYAQATSELATMQITDPLLQELTQNYAYVTRFLGRMSPEEMTLDPVFGFDSELEDVSNIRDLRQSPPEIFWSCPPKEEDNSQNRLPLGTSIALIGILPLALIVKRSKDMRKIS